MDILKNAYIDVSNRGIVLPNKNSVHANSTPNIQMDSHVNEAQVKVVFCTNCGANNKVVEGKVCECEYCGSLLK